MDSVTTAFFLTTLAGLSTGLGSLIALLVPEIKFTRLSILLGFAAGAMIYISFVELLVEAVDAVGFFRANAAFFLGMIGMGLLDRIIWHVHLDTLPDGNAFPEIGDSRLRNNGLLTAAGIAMHNFPEGMAVLAASLSSPYLGVSVAVAIAIHNIPEGVAVSVPIYYASKDRKKAFAYSFLAGLTEPLGAVLGYFLLFRFLNPEFLSLVLAAVGGLMVFICFDELLPIAIRYGDEHLAFSGLLFGMAVVALSLYFLS
ncbi:zinc transporter ZupT [Methanosarcina sp. KYL-1]|uniref:zinc transporter ZupT n=1 Tax=Methanosarcina sp. KYL-1 TaxID=2602068 RepID=UPI002100D8F3|nr:zinc transporter ZupT [Methanosarcina sp. KYL-1]MCQ1537167.1 zinc transporter ZupT [Methanosarcina sp. KYL-1]